MKITHTPPGTLPEASPSARSLERGRAAFRTSYRLLRAPEAPLDWRRLLRLDVAPDRHRLFRPPREEASNLSPAAKRLLWRHTLDRHVRRWPVESAVSASAEERTSVERMLALLSRYKELEEAAEARHASEPQR